MLEVDVNGLMELEGGKPPARLALEPVANVFDESRGYVEGRKKPSYCAVTLAHQNNPRGVLVTVADDGAGFSNESDVYTLFGSTPKRSNVGVAGRFNLGDKQVIAVSRWAKVQTNDVTVEFCDGKRTVTRHRTVQVAGTIIKALMPWSLKDLEEVREQLRGVLPPAGLAYTVDGIPVERPATRCVASVTLPTVKLQDGVMRPATAKTSVTVLKTTTPTLFELGIPVYDLTNLGFPWSLDVHQKVPVPPSRDMVSLAYLYRLVGSVLEQAALDGVHLLSEEERGEPFIKGALDWVRDMAALKVIVHDLYGPNPVRPTGNPTVDRVAVDDGANLVSGKNFTEDTRKRLNDSGIMPTASQKYADMSARPRPNIELRCPHCGGLLN